MRISDDRYNRDRMRFDLALRMMSHQARTSTIRLWTGLSEDRIRKLYKAYRPNGERVRYRGRSPRQAVHFLQTATVCFEATTLASILHTAGLLTGRLLTPDGAPLTLERAVAFCEAFEVYLRLSHGIYQGTHFSFEHAAFLMVSLVNGHHLKLIRCVQCGRLYLAEVERMMAPSCGCGQRCCGWPRRGRLPKNLIQAYDEWRARPLLPLEPALLSTPSPSLSEEQVDFAALQSG